MPFHPSLDMSVRISAPVEVVWAALTDARYIKKWWPSLTIELGSKAGGRFRIDNGFAIANGTSHDDVHYRAKGTISEHTRNELIVVQLTSKPGGYHTELRLELTQLKRKTKLQLVESRFPEDHATAGLVTDSRNRWRHFLDALSEYLKDDKRVEKIKRRLDE